MLYEIAEQLKDNTIDLSDAIWALDTNDVLLRWFACDCAERSLEREKQYTYTSIDIRSLQAVEFARKIAHGDAALEHIHRIRYNANDAARAASGDGASDAASATVEDSARYAAMASSSHAQRAAAQYTSRAKELRWQQHRLAYLCEVWAICGHRACWMLFEGACPIEPHEEAQMQSR